MEERTSGSLTSTKQFVWCGSRRCEERDASSTLVSQFFRLGQRTSSTDYFYTLDHLGSVREMINRSSGAIAAQYKYDPYGQTTKIQGSGDADFQFAGMYNHARSGLSLTFFRQYNASLGRWLSRDPIGESGGLNMYGYAGNNPISFIDPLGLQHVGSWPVERALAKWANPAEGDNPSPVYVRTSDTGFNGRFDPSIFPTMQKWINEAKKDAAKSGSPRSKGFRCLKRGATSTENFLTYGDFTLSFNGGVTVYPDGSVAISGSLSGADYFDFDPAGPPWTSRRGFWGESAVWGVAGVGAGIGAVGYDINLTPIPVYFTVAPK